MTVPPAQVNTGPLRVSVAPPIRVTATLPPQAVLPFPTTKSFVIRFPTNAAGVVSLRDVSLPRGTVLNLTFAGG